MKWATFVMAFILLYPLQLHKDFDSAHRSARPIKAIRQQANIPPPYQVRWVVPNDPQFRNLSTIVLDNTRLLVTGVRFPKDPLIVPPLEMQENHIQTIEAASGKVLSDWKLPIGTRIEPIKSTALGVVAHIVEWTQPVDEFHNAPWTDYVGLFDITVQRVLWKNPKAVAMHEAILVAGNWVIYSGGEGQPLYAAELSTGKILGRSEEGILWLPFSVDRDQAYLPAGTEGDKVYTLCAYQLPAMTKLWQRKDTYSIVPTATGRLIALSTPTHNRLEIACLDRGGHEIWSRTMPYDGDWDPVCSRDAVVAYTNAGLLCLDISTGRRRWLLPGVSLHGYTSIDFVGDLMYLWDRFGISVRRMRDGRLIWHRGPFGDISVVDELGYTIVCNGLILCSTNEHLIALEPVKK